MKFVLTSFLAWKIWTFVFLLIGIYFIPLQLNFLGGGLEHYLRTPWFWAWGNFDGEHYLAIAQHGYGNGEQAFFPLYILLIRLLASRLWQDIYLLQFLGLIISNASFLFGLFGLWKLVKLDFKDDLARLVVLLLLSFPTSFYFGSVYTEGFLFSFIVWSFYFARKGNWLFASIFGALATAVKFIGIVLLPALAVEYYLQNNSKLGAKWLFLALIPLGLVSYMFYLSKTVGDPFSFLHSFTFFGEQRSTSPVLLPQVFLRYVRILIDVPKDNILFLTVTLESLTAVLFLFASIVSFLKLRLSYAVFLLLGYLIPTLPGSFSSLPRYVVVLFPAFIIFAISLKKRSTVQQAVVIAASFILLGVSTALFARGYWIA